MKYLIINNYDSTYEFSICVNGKTERYYRRRIPNSLLCEDLFEMAKWETTSDFKHKVIEKYGADFDLIVLCEDGKIEVFKDDVEVGK